MKIWILENLPWTESQEISRMTESYYSGRWSQGQMAYLKNVLCSVPNLAQVFLQNGHWKQHFKKIIDNANAFVDHSLIF